MAIFLVMSLCGRLPLSFSSASWLCAVAMAIEIEGARKLRNVHKTKSRRPPDETLETRSGVSCSSCRRSLRTNTRSFIGPNRVSLVHRRSVHPAAAAAAATATATAAHVDSGGSVGPAPSSPPGHF